jgi:hypothetical protein
MGSKPSSSRSSSSSSKHDKHTTGQVSEALSTLAALAASSIVSEKKNKGDSLGTFHDIPDVLVTCIWRYLDLRGHLIFRRCCRYLNHQSHVRHDIGPLYTRFTLEHPKDITNFRSIAALRPWSFKYYFDYEDDVSSMTSIWPTITTLRELQCEMIPSSILATQTGLTMLQIDTLVPIIVTLTNLQNLQLTSLPLFRWGEIPSSLTSLRCGMVAGSFWDESSRGIINHLSRLSRLRLNLPSTQSPLAGTNGELAAINEWLSLKHLHFSNRALPAFVFQGFRHIGVSNNITSLFAF